MAACAATKDTGCRINAPRLLQRLHALRQVGCNAAGGIDRQLGSPADSEARKWLLDCWQKELGLQVEVDAIANLWGIRPGQHLQKAIVLGSHHDTVPNGGWLDGALGVLMATEIFQTLQENGVKLRHPLGIVSFTGEEPNSFGVSTLGTKVLSRRLGRAALGALRDCKTGESLVCAVERLGGNPAAIPEGTEPLLGPQEIAAFMECHIEQGRRLFDAGEAVAAVTCITGIYREIISIQRDANHAGTTLPIHRRDALAGAAEVVLAVEHIMQEPAMEGLTATVGHLEVQPNASNIIPGEVLLTLDLRTAQPAKRQLALEKLTAAIDGIQNRRGIRIDRRLDLDQPEMPLDEDLITALEDSMAANGHPCRRLVSMAGHDAANMARLTKSAMLFVQSIDGRSHCPQEDTNGLEIAQAAQVLLDAVLLLDRRLSL